MLRKGSYILWLDEVDKTDGGLAGDKGAGLSEMVQAGFPVDKAFIVSSYAYFAFIRENKLFDKIHNLLYTAHFGRPDSLMQISDHIRRLIVHGRMTEEMVKEIFFAYRKLSGIFGDAWVAVRTSPTEQELAFLGSEESYLNVRGEANLILKIKEGWASLFEPKIIIYAHEKKMDLFRYGMAMIVQKMIEPDRSGIIYTVDPVTNDKKKIVIEAIYGLSELLYKGRAVPDRYEINKTDLEIVNKNVGIQIHLLKKAGNVIKKVDVPSSKAGKQKLSQNKILDLALLGKRLERHYYFPQEIEWAIEKNKIYIVKAKAFSAINKNTGNPNISEKLQLILKAIPASPGIATGKVKIVTNDKDIDESAKGDILVAGKIHDFKRAAKKAVAIILDHGGRASHNSIVAREAGIPAVAGAEEAGKMLRNGMIVTVNGGLGEIYKGGVGKQSHFRTATRIYEDIGGNIYSSNAGQKNSDGAGLLRAEFLMANMKAHPKKFVRNGKGEVYSQKLAEQIGYFCEAFTGRPVVYRACDFSTSDFRKLEGGEDFESIEVNPILGFRGAYRYIYDPEIFNLEVEAIKIARNKMGHNNLWMMIPFCRTVKELIEVKRILSVAGLHRGGNFKLWMSAEVPASVVLIDKFIEAGIDGVSIGLSGLTMLLLATDPENSEVAAEYDERNEAVLRVLENAIKACHKHRISSSIYGGSISRYPDLLEKMVQWGISSVTVAPDSAESTRDKIFEIERRLVVSR